MNILNEYRLNKAKLALKDIMVISLTMSLVYIALNNSYVRPSLQLSQGSSVWSIDKREHKLLMGLSGHNYLELVDNNNKVISQIHGFAYDPINGEIVERATRSGYKLKVFVFDYNYYKVNDYYLKENNNKNIVKYNTYNENNIKISNANDIDMTLPGTELYSGDMSSTLVIWAKAKLCAAEIDNQDIDYPRYGFKIINETENSNSVAHSIANCSGLSDTPVGLLTPGSNTNLIRINQK